MHSTADNAAFYVQSEQVSRRASWGTDPAAVRGTRLQTGLLNTGHQSLLAYFQLESHNENLDPIDAQGLLKQLAWHGLALIQPHTATS